LAWGDSAWYYTGARLSDVANMQWSAIDLRKQIHPIYAEQTKKAGDIPLHSQLERELVKKRRRWQGVPVSILAGKGTAADMA
jgi:integrase